MLGSWDFSGEPGHAHISLCASSLCGVPGRYEYIWSLCWCGWRAGTDFLFSLPLFGVFCVIEMEGGAGQYGFSSFYVLFGGYGTIEMAGLCCNSFSLSLVSCQYSWRADMCGRNIVIYFLWHFVAVSCGFFIFKLVIVDNLFQEVFEDLVP